MADWKRAGDLSMAALFLTAAPLALACGAVDASAPNGQVQQAIQGGYVDAETSGVVGLGIFEQDHFFVGHCSGTLIAPNLVLTARHCVTQLSPDEHANEVECGVTDFRRTRAADTLVVSPQTERPESPLDPSFVSGLSVHPVPGADDVCGYDVALIVLERNLTASEAHPIVPRIDIQPVPSEAFSAEGYGLTSDQADATSGLRMRIDGNEVLCSPSECHLDYPDIVTESEWLTADAGVCSGDSGGPALDGEGRVIGVASRGGDECRATIYGDVTWWGDFIIEIALEAALLGDYPAPFWTSGSSEAPEGAPAPVEEPDEAVVLDESTADEGEATSDHGDVECDPGECGRRDDQRFAAEAGCHLVRGATPRVGGVLGWSVLWALALGLRRRSRTG